MCFYPLRSFKKGQSRQRSPSARELLEAIKSECLPKPNDPCPPLPALSAFFEPGPKASTESVEALVLGKDEEGDDDDATMAPDDGGECIDYFRDFSQDFSGRFDESIEYATKGSTEDMANDLAGEHVGEPVSELASEQVGEQVGEQAGEQAGEQVNEPVGQPVVELAGEPVSELADEPAGKVADEPVNELAGELAVEPASEPIVESIGGPVGYGIEELPKLHRCPTRRDGRGAIVSLDPGTTLDFTSPKEVVALDPTPFQDMYESPIWTETPENCGSFNRSSVYQRFGLEPPHDCIRDDEHAPEQVYTRDGIPITPELFERYRRLREWRSLNETHRPTLGAAPQGRKGRLDEWGCHRGPEEGRRVYENRWGPPGTSSTVSTSGLTYDSIPSSHYGSCNSSHVSTGEWLRNRAPPPVSGPPRAFGLGLG